MANIRKNFTLLAAIIAVTFGSAGQASDAETLNTVDKFKISISIGPTPSGATGADPSCVACPQR